MRFIDGCTPTKILELSARILININLIALNIKIGILNDRARLNMLVQSLWLQGKRFFILSRIKSINFI